MKNYEKIYKRLIKEIKRMKREENNPNNYRHESNAIMKEVEKRASQYAISTLARMLEMNEEIEGKKCNMVIMNQASFKKWKEKIINVKNK